MHKQELTIAHYKNMTEAVGRDIVLQDEGSSYHGVVEGKQRSEIVDYMIEMVANNLDVHDDTQATLEQHDVLLQRPFDFYGTDLRLNDDS